MKESAVRLNRLKDLEGFLEERHSETNAISYVPMAVFSLSPNRYGDKARINMETDTIPLIFI